MQSQGQHVDQVNALVGYMTERGQSSVVLVCRIHEICIH
jgi:hypothetical protein